MAKSNKVCTIPVCDNHAEVGDLCKPCYSSMYYWGKKTPTQIIDRQKKLRLYDSRLSTFSNTRFVKGRKRKAA